MELLTWLRAQWDRCAAWVLIVAGVIVLILGWLGVSRYPYPANQMPYIISGGIGGLILVGLGAMFWLSADLRDEWRMLRRIDAALRDNAAVALVVDSPPGTVAPPGAADGDQKLGATASEAATTENPVYVEDGRQEALVGSTPTPPARTRSARSASTPPARASRSSAGRSRSRRAVDALPSEQ